MAYKKPNIFSSKLSPGTHKFYCSQCGKRESCSEYQFEWRQNINNFTCSTCTETNNEKSNTKEEIKEYE